MNELEVVARQLRRHALRRKTGVPTISVIVGDAATCAPLLETSLAHAGLARLSTRLSALAQLAATWLDAVTQEHDLLAAAMLELSGGGDLAPGWRARAPAERRMWLEQLAGRGIPTARAAASWLARRADGTATEREADPIDAMVELAAWLRPEAWPVLCVVVEESAAIVALPKLAALVPALPLAAVIPPLLWTECMSAGTSRDRALLLEGRIEVPSLSVIEPQLMFQSAASGVAPSAAKDVEAIQALARAAYIEAMQAWTTRTPAEAEAATSRARSLAELLLYELLQAEPGTRGLFELNGLMPFAFGSRAAEVDLVSTELTLAIEVDGYHHFTEAAAYRRDRRKDLLLQTKGFWVMRILAADVVEQHASVLESIKELVLVRRNVLEECGGRR